MTAASKPPHVLLLSVPGLRPEDLSRMPALAALAALGGKVLLAPSFPAVTCPVQATLTTGAAPRGHGIVANGIYDRSSRDVEMWISPDSVHRRDRIWDRLKSARPELRTAAWFLLQSKHATADLVCLPAPRHNADGTETMWCHTNPEPLYASLRETLGDFPLHKFWGPLAGIDSTRWIVRSFLEAAKEAPPHLAVVYLPHLDYAAQRAGPDSQAAHAACGELDSEIATLVEGFGALVGIEQVTVLVAGEYRIRAVTHASLPNRTLREAGLLVVKDSPDGEVIDMEKSQAWALADHQVSHIFLKLGLAREERDKLVQRIHTLFDRRRGVKQVYSGAALIGAGLSETPVPSMKSRCGDVVIESTPDSWQAYQYWLSDAKAPRFARTIDIHKKPGYDPLELFIDRTAAPPPGMPFGIPLDTSLVKGSHGAIDADDPHETLLVCSRPDVIGSEPLHARDLAGIILRQFQSPAGTGPESGPAPV
ncbi:MAG: alkaline phosphatase family protein [Planctomycetota bacterium]|nr:MAG: alkaline phosphatase family protein [Planctomycetota bacterium]